MTRRFMCPKKKFKNLFNQMYKLCEKEGWGDPFSYARSKEILAACELGHDVTSTPMLLAVPLTILIALSIFEAFKSGILISAISLT